MLGKLHCGILSLTGEHQALPWSPARVDFWKRAWLWKGKFREHKGSKHECSKHNFREMKLSFFFFRSKISECLLPYKCPCIIILGVAGIEERVHMHPILIPVEGLLCWWENLGPSKFAKASAIGIVWIFSLILLSSSLPLTPYLHPLSAHSQSRFPSASHPWHHGSSSLIPGPFPTSPGSSLMRTPWVSDSTL